MEYSKSLTALSMRKTRPSFKWGVSRGRLLVHACWSTAGKARAIYALVVWLGRLWSLLNLAVDQAYFRLD